MRTPEQAEAIAKVADGVVVGSALVELVGEHLAAGDNQYAPMPGLLRLREAVARKLAVFYRAPVDPANEITIMPGATQAIFCAVQTVVRPGDEVIVFDPAYDSYEPAITLAGGITRHVPLSLPGFGIDFDQLDAALSDRTRLVIVNTPHNPSGALLDESDLERLTERLRSRDCYLLSDEVYEHIVFDGAPHRSVLTHPELASRAFVVSSFGKTFHATGWKVGYCVAPAALTAELRRVHQYVSFATVTPIQHALARFMEEYPVYERELPAFYQARRDEFCALLAGTRFRFEPARSTYFQLADYREISDLPDTEFARWLTEAHGVAAIPVSVFCAAPSPMQSVRFCFAKQSATLKAAAGKLRAL